MNEPVWVPALDALARDTASCGDRSRRGAPPVSGRAEYLKGPRPSPVMVRLLACALPVLLLVPMMTVAQSDPPTLVPNQGPDVPGAGFPVATIEAINHHFAWGSYTHRVTVDAPDVTWTRAILEFHSYPHNPGGDPWDRTFIVGVQNTEVLHGTTTRGDFTLTEDITNYASLMRGDTFDVWVQSDSWVPAGHVAEITLAFFDEPVPSVVRPEYDRVVSPITKRGLGGPGSQAVATVDFGTAPASATIEFFTSGHGQQGEFWYQYGLTPPQFTIYVDEVPVGKVVALPYVYALLGFCCGAQSEAINQYAWWSGHQVLDAAGVHHGVGEIPSYRAELPADLAAMLSGEREVKVVKHNHGGSWPTSVNFLMND